MRLNYNSISAKLYRWFYGTDSMYSNLCPYFWRLVIMWVLLLPYVLLTLPAQVITLFRRKSLSDSFGYTFAFYFVSFILTVFGTLPIAYLFNLTFEKDTFWDVIFYTSIGVWVLLLGCGSLYLILLFWYNVLYKKTYNSYWKKPNIVVEFIKAKYNKYCPKIEWENEPNETDND